MLKMSGVMIGYVVEELEPIRDKLQMIIGGYATCYLKYNTDLRDNYQKVLKQ